MISEKEVNKWFYNLDESVKQGIIDNIYPGELISDLDESWKYLDWKIKLEVFRENNP
jgi:hypothetical protein